jgi:hypothetical protein
MHTKAILSAVCLSVFLSVETIVIKYINLHTNTKIPSEQLVILIELCKLVVSIVSYLLHNTPSSAETIPLLRTKYQSSGFVFYLFPAILYTISNNITYFALAEMSSAMYNLLMNIKIPLTATMTWAFLNYKINRRLLSSFLILFIGASFGSTKFLINSNGNFSIHLNTTFKGLGFMLIYTFCSSGASILMEYITKIKHSLENIYIQNIKFSTCSIMCNLIVLLYHFIENKIVPFQTLLPIHLVVILVIYGLVTSAVIKFGGSLLKTYSVSSAMFLSAILSIFVFHTVFIWNFYLGAIFCYIAIHLYAQEIKKLAR